jgi:hypothetical protein
MNTDQKLDRLIEDIGEIKQSQVGMQKDLAHHIYRTDLAEQSIGLLRSEVEPIKRHVDMVSGGLKLIGAVIVMAGLILTVMQIFKG